MKLLGVLRTKGQRPAPPQGAGGGAKAQGATVVRATDLTKTYAADGVEVRALRGVSVDVEAGSLIAFIGPSGSGKTTLLNLLGCLDKPSSGGLEVSGTDVTRLDRRQAAAFRGAQIGFVFQSFNLLPRTSALENVALPLIYAGTGRKDRFKQAWAKLEAVSLSDRADHHPSQLSGGQQQRVAIARALVNEPVLLLADEPTGNLDSRTSVEIMALFQELNAQGLTIVVVTHEPDIAQYATRIVTFRDGRIVKDERNASPLSAQAVLPTLPASGEGM